MKRNPLLSTAIKVIQNDATHHDITFERRTALLTILWNERFLTRAQLIARIEQILGKNCYGEHAWEDNFYRDIRIVKRAFQKAGFALAYSRHKAQKGYYLIGQPRVAPEYAEMIRNSAAEVDPGQVEIYRQLTPAQRYHQGAALSDTARKVVTYRILQENPNISPREAKHLALARAYGR